jgi:hypothetical protein
MKCDIDVRKDLDANIVLSKEIAGGDWKGDSRAGTSDDKD